MNEFLLWLQTALQDYSLVLGLMFLFFAIAIFVGLIAIIIIYNKIDSMFMDYQVLLAQHNRTLKKRKKEKKKCQNKR